MNKSSKIVPSSPQPLHISQAFNLQTADENFDFFDANLSFDSRLYIDPFLLRKSNNQKERELFDHFGDLFRFAYDLALKVSAEDKDYDKLREFLKFEEPKEINLGYTELSNRGRGKGQDFANLLFNFFLTKSASRLVKEELLYPDGKFNPFALEVLTSGLGPDGIGDITTNLIADYLIKYTQERAKALGLPLKSLPVDTDGFNFDPDEMRWNGGNYYDLPENPIHKGEAIIFVPNRLLRAIDVEGDKRISRIVGILREDLTLREKFTSLISKKISEVSLKEVQEAIIKDNSILKKYIQLLEREHVASYDFNEDKLGFLGFRKYFNFFKTIGLPATIKIKSCKELFQHINKFINIFNEEMIARDGWKNMWKDVAHTKPQPESTLGRHLRSMGFAYFAHLPEVTFIAEMGTGRGPVDFTIIYLNCRVAIELKLLSSSDYIHGIQIQLPAYIRASNVSHAIYLTGQHWTRENRPKINHDNRVTEIKNILPLVLKELKKTKPNFINLTYRNIDLSPKPPASNIRTALIK